MMTIVGLHQPKGLKPREISTRSWTQVSRSTHPKLGFKGSVLPHLFRNHGFKTSQAGGGGGGVRMSQENLHRGSDQVGSWTVPDAMESSGTSFSRVNLNTSDLDSPLTLVVAANLPGSAQTVEEKSDDLKQRNPRKAAKLPALECVVRPEGQHDVAGQEYGAASPAVISSSRSPPVQQKATVSSEESALGIVQRRASVSSEESALGIAKSSEVLRSDFLGRLELELAQAGVAVEVGAADGSRTVPRTESQSMAKSRWKAAAKVVAPEKKMISRQQSIAILAGNLSKKTGKHAMKNILDKLSTQQVERMLAYNEMEKLTGHIVAEFDKVKNKQKAKGE